jgi:exodeoxyribonuclease VII large subunit
MPVISAVGHETDTTLVDLVADVRAATPSAAAAAATPDRAAVVPLVGGLARRLAHSLSRRAELGRERLARTGDRLEAVMREHTRHRSARLGELAAALDALSPLRVLERGYAVARDDDGRVLRRVAQFQGGRRFRLTVADGDVRARAEDAA